MNLATKLKLCQLCTFRAGDLLLGVDVHVVQEVNRFQEMTPVPLSGPGIEGLINLRGEIVTAIDLRTQLGLEPRAEGVQPMNVVVRTGGGIASLLVDEIGDVLNVDPDSLELPPSTVTGRLREFLQAVYKLDGELLLVLDPARASRVDERTEVA
jgi:purine-binding chemotaxis protein CheW